jgi:hypothetical protein
VSLPVTVDCVAYRGDSWQQQFRFLDGAVPVDLTGATVEAEARDPAGDVHPLQVTVDAATGLVTISMPAGSLPAASYMYDVEVVKAGVVTTWVRGRLAVSRDVTNELPSAV